MSGAQTCPCSYGHEAGKEVGDIVDNQKVQTGEEVNMVGRGDEGMIFELQAEVVSLRKELDIKNQELSASRKSRDCPQLSACEAAKKEAERLSQDRDLRMKSLSSKNRRLLDRLYSCHSEKG